MSTHDINPAPNDSKVRRQMIDESNDERLEKLREHALKVMDSLLNETQAGTMAHPDYEVWGAFVGEIEADQRNRAISSEKFYFRIVLPTLGNHVLDRVVCVQRRSRADAEDYMVGRADAKSWESISPEQLPENMEFKPALAQGVWESTTGFTPLPPRPTDPRDRNAKRNP